MNHQCSWFARERLLRDSLVPNKRTPSKKSGIVACISSRISTVIHSKEIVQNIYDCFNEPFAVSSLNDLYLDMHGLTFETSISLLAGSTRWTSISIFWRLLLSGRASNTWGLDFILIVLQIAMRKESTIGQKLALLYVARSYHQAVGNKMVNLNHP